MEGSEFFGPKTNSCRDCMVASPKRLEDGKNFTVNNGTEQIACMSNFNC